MNRASVQTAGFRRLFEQANPPVRPKARGPRPAERPGRPWQSADTKQSQRLGRAGYLRARRRAAAAGTRRRAAASVQCGGRLHLLETKWLGVDETILTST